MVQSLKMKIGKKEKQYYTEGNLNVLEQKKIMF